MEVTIAQISSLRSRLGATVETSQTKPTHPSKQRRHGFWISRVVLLLGLLFLLYCGYCWGWWGRNSLLLQLLFQCGCPASSNESRYPEQVDVIIPACQHNGVILSPSGRLLYVNKYILWDNVGYFWNLQTDERISHTIQRGSNYFLTDDLIFHENDEYILDRTTGKQYPIQKFRYWRSDAYVNGEVNLDLLVQGLQEAKYVFLIDDDIVIALISDFRSSSEDSFFTGWFDIPGRSSDRVEEFLQEHDIPYINTATSTKYPREAISPNNRFIARDDGIYLTETDKKIVDGFSVTREYRPASGKYFSVIGWVYDGSGAIYSKRENVCLLEMNVFVSDVCIIKVSQPVLLLKIPDEYLLSLR